MSNVTPQIALNKGYTPIGQEKLAGNTPGTPLTGVTGTNAILISAAAGSTVFIGNSAVTDDGAQLDTRPVIIETNTPTDFCIGASGPGNFAQITYLALNT